MVVYPHDIEVFEEIVHIPIDLVGHFGIVPELEVLHRLLVSAERLVGHQQVLGGQSISLQDLLEIAEQRDELVRVLQVVLEVVVLLVQVVEVVLLERREHAMDQRKQGIKDVKQALRRFDALCHEADSFAPDFWSVLP